MNMTTWVLVAVVAFLIGYDIFAVVKWGYQGTISYDVLKATTAHPIISFAMGIVCGHLFWPQ